MFYFIVFISGFILSLGLTFLIQRWATKKNIAMATPRVRDIHQKPVPRLGGVAIFISFWLVVAGILIFNPNQLVFVQQKIGSIDKNLMGLIVASVIWFIIGLIDDIKGLKPWIKLVAQIVCGIVIVAFGIKIWWLSNPAGGLNIVLNYWTYILVPIWVVLLMNVTNWLDGVDGLASSISFITLIVLFLLAIDPAVNQTATAILCVILAGAVLGLLPSNWNPAKIFLGDTGSGFLGLMIATFAIISGAKLATAFLVLGIPILDAIIVIVGRVKGRRSIFSADTSHLHHKFLQVGFSPKQTVLILSFISIIFGIIALRTQTQGKMTAILWLSVVMGIILIALFIARRKRERSK